ncbi:MAG: hypothetical protein R2711_16615 [Acidimicrobiales bacterium]
MSVGYPDRGAELAILASHGDHEPLDDVRPVVTAAQVNGLVAAARSVHVAPPLQGTWSTWPRPPGATRASPWACRPRATLSLQRAKRARAAHPRPGLRHARRHQGARQPGARPPHPAGAGGALGPGGARRGRRRRLARRGASGPRGARGRARRAAARASVPTRAGWTVLAGALAALGAGRLLGVLELYVLAAVAVALVLAAVAWVRRPVPALALHREVHPVRPTRGAAARSTSSSATWVGGPPRCSPCATWSRARSAPAWWSRPSWRAAPARSATASDPAAAARCRSAR